MNLKERFLLDPGFHEKVQHWINEISLKIEREGLLRQILLDLYTKGECYVEEVRDEADILTGLVVFGDVSGVRFKNGKLLEYVQSFPGVKENHVSAKNVIALSMRSKE